MRRGSGFDGDRLLGRCRFGPEDWRPAGSAVNGWNMSIRGDSFTLALDVNCALGESPVWVAERGLLIFVDISGRKLYRYDTEANEVEHVGVDEDIGCVAVARGGGYVAGLRSGVWLLNES